VDAWHAAVGATDRQCRLGHPGDGVRCGPHHPAASASAPAPRLASPTRTADSCRVARTRTVTVGGQVGSPVSGFRRAATIKPTSSTTGPTAGPSLRRVLGPGGQRQRMGARCRKGAGAPTDG
jgi:hypothetical protein